MPTLDPPHGSQGSPTIHLDFGAKKKGVRWGMGELRRRTRAELDALSEVDAGWWGGVCEALAEKGEVAMREERERRGWSWGALWRWIVEDEVRYTEYVQALEAHVQMLALETVGIADADGDAKLRVDTRFKLAGKVDRERWGERAVQMEKGAVLLDAGLLGTMVEMLGRLSGPTVAQDAGRVIEHQRDEI